MVTKKNPEPEKTPEQGFTTDLFIIDEIKDFTAADNLPTHQLSAREQLMIQWPGSSWELR